VSGRVEESRLGDFVNFQNGYAFKSGSYTKSGHYLIRIKNVQQGYIEVNDECFVKIPSDAKFKKFILKSGDIVVSLTGNVGRIARIKEVHLPAALNQRVASATPKNEKVLSSEYLYYLLRAPEFLEYAIKSGKGAAQQNISTADMEKFEVQIPSLEKQRAIVEKLDSALAEIELIVASTEKEKSESKELFRQICNGFLQKLDPTGYSPLRDLSQVITKGTTPTSIGQKFVSKGINFLKVESLNQVGGFVENKFAFIDAGCHQVLGRSQLQNDDLLVSIAGALGRTAIVTDEILPANINQALALVRLPGESRILPQFIYSLFQAGFFDEVVLKMSAGAAQQNISLAQIGSLQIPMLASEQQLLFIDFIDNLMECTDEFVTAINRKKELLHELNSSVLSSVLLNE
jgi:restriction endonuclease S subunit